MAGIRDTLIHDYFGVDLAIVWKTINEDLAALEPGIRSILSGAKDQQVSIQGSSRRAGTGTCQ